MKVDISLISKYNVAGPRYTSYPTAPHFSETCDTLKLQEESAQSQTPLSLYVHIPFCQSLCWFCGCTKIISKDFSQADSYLELIDKEMLLFSKRQKHPRCVAQIHLGGGTPNFLTPQQITRLFQLIRKHFNVLSDAEISTELDPRTLSKQQVDAFALAGVNRASIGVQDVCSSVQKSIHRIQTNEQNTQALLWLREAHIASCNMDLIYGLPEQSNASFQHTLHHILTFRPDRLAVFSYAHVPWAAPSQKILEKKNLPSPEEKMAMLASIIDILTSNGYHYVGMDHFALESDPLAIAQKNGTLQRNFQGYSTHKGLEIAAFGMSSISQTLTSYRQNFKDLATYAKALQENKWPIARGILLTPKDQLIREVIHHIMCRCEIDFQDIEKKYSIDFTHYFKAALALLTPLCQDGLVTIDASSLSVTEQGRLFLRNIAMAFDSYLQQHQARFSKTV